MKLNPLGPNCNEVQFTRGLVLFSYKTPVAVSLYEVIDGHSVGVYRTTEQFSNTTSRHINRWTSTNRTLDQAEIESLAEKLGS
jgi:hypothetical protein